MSFGKLPLPSFINNVRIGNCVVCPAVGEDDAVIEVKGKYLVVHSDPITESGKDAGYLSVVVACNDVNMKGVECKWVLTTILLSDKAHLNGVLRGVNEACNKIGCSVVGGHTEVIDSKRDIVVTTALGETDALIDGRSVKEGDYVLLVGDLGLEGSWILATQFASLLKAKGVRDETLKRAREFREELSVQEKALKVSRFVKFMHDVTDGGLLQCSLELARRFNSTIKIDEKAIALREEVKEIVDALSIDPLRFISSGAFLVITDDPNAVKSKVRAQIIGRVERGDPVVVTERRVISDDVEEELARIESDYNGWWERD